MVVALTCGLRPLLRLLIVFLVVCAAGCSATSSTEHREGVGELRLPLTTSAWGGTYRLRGVFVVRAGTAPDEVDVTALSTDTNPDAVLLSTPLAPGEYSILLSPNWHLERSENGDWATVSADLSSDNPLSVTITAGSATQATFRFVVRATPESSGTLTIGIDVQEQPVCGDRVVAPAEACDDGALNGTANHCDTSCLFVCPGGCPLRVNPSVAPGGSGRSWDDPLSDVQAAIDRQAALGGGAVWVVTGNFNLPVQDQGVVISLHSNVQLMGGFQGTESTPAQRDPTLARTQLNDPRPPVVSTGVPGYAIESIEQSDWLVERIHFTTQWAPLHVQGGADLQLREVTLFGPLQPLQSSLRDTELRFESSEVGTSWSVANTNLAFVDTHLTPLSGAAVNADASQVMLERAVTEIGLNLSSGSHGLVKQTTVTGTPDVYGLINVSGTPGVDDAATVSTMTMMDSQVLIGGAQTPIAGGSMFIWNSSFVNMRSQGAHGIDPRAAAIYANDLEVALSTFFNNTCQTGFGDCSFDIRTDSTGLVHNSLFVRPDLPLTGPPDNLQVPNPISGSPRLTGNCITSARDQFIVNQGQVLAVQHPCLDAGDADELEAARQRLLTRVQAFLSPPFDADVSNYQNPEWWRSQTVVEAGCTDAAAPDPGRHYLIECGSVSP